MNLPSLMGGLLVLAVVVPVATGSIGAEAGAAAFTACDPISGDPAGFYLGKTGIGSYGSFSLINVGAEAFAEGDSTLTGAKSDLASWVDSPGGGIASISDSASLRVPPGTWMYSKTKGMVTGILAAYDSDQAATVCLPGAPPSGNGVGFPGSSAVCDDQSADSIIGAGGIHLSSVGDSLGRHTFLVAELSDGSAFKAAWDNVARFSNIRADYVSFTDLPVDSVKVRDVAFSLVPDVCVVTTTSAVL